MTNNRQFIYTQFSKCRMCRIALCLDRFLMDFVKYRAYNFITHFKNKVWKIMVKTLQRHPSYINIVKIKKRGKCVILITKFINNTDNIRAPFSPTNCVPILLHRRRHRRRVYCLAIDTILLWHMPSVSYCVFVDGTQISLTHCSALTPKHREWYRKELTEYVNEEVINIIIIVKNIAHDQSSVIY